MKKLRWGIIGAANIAKKQVIPAIQQTNDGEIIAIASRSEKKHSNSQATSTSQTYTSHTKH